MGPAILKMLGDMAGSLNPRQVSEITDLLRKGDEAGAAQYLQYIAAASRTDDYVPRGTKSVRVGNTALSVPGSREEIPYTPGKPLDAAPAPAAPGKSTPKASPQSAAPQRRGPKDAAGNSIRQLLSPVRMPNSPLFLSDLPEASVPYSRASLAGAARERALADGSLLGDFKKVLGYGAIPGAAGGLAVRSVAERSEDSGSSTSRGGGRSGVPDGDKPWELMTSEEYLQHLRSKGFK
jgi:hypothetical protein